METQNNNLPTFIKADKDTIINIVCIRWVKKLDQCLYICSKNSGCSQSETLSVCKNINPDSYLYLHKLFE